MPAKHYRLSPSGASRWMNCPGSLRLSEGLERKESEYAKEGTRAHALAEQLVRGMKPAVAPEDQEMLDAVMVYVNEIETYRRNYSVRDEYTERTLECTEIPGLGGTSDHVMFYKDGDKYVCHIWDYKHGAGVPVDVTENKQVLSYAVIIQDYIGGFIDHFRATIVQPRAFAGDAIQTWEFDHHRVEKHAEEIKEAVKQDYLRAGDHCRWCPALSICPENMRHALTLAQAEFADIRGDADRLIELMEITPAVKAFLDAVPQMLMEMFRQGKGPEGWKVVERKSHRKWALSDKEVLKALEDLGVTSPTRSELKTPPQIEKELPKDKRKELTKLTKTVVLGHTVVPATARGEAVDISSINDFKEFSDGEAN